MWNFFDKIYCINLDRRTDRWKASQEEFARVGITADRFAAYEFDNHCLAFNKSQHECLKRFVEPAGINKGPCLVLEDDIEFRHWSHLYDALLQLPSDWDCLWLGANINGQNLKRYTSNLFHIKNSFTTHAVAYSHKMAKWIVENFNPDEFPIYDEWLRINVQEKFKCFLVAPMIAYQRPDRSDIWGTNVDYTQTFEQGNLLLS